MNKKEKAIVELENKLDSIESLEYRIDEEGIDYTLDGYSKWDDIDNEKFHHLRKNFLSLKKEIFDHIKHMKKQIDSQINELNNSPEE